MEEPLHYDFQPYNIRGNSASCEQNSWSPPKADTDCSPKTQVESWPSITYADKAAKLDILPVGIHRVAPAVTAESINK